MAWDERTGWDARARHFATKRALESVKSARRPERARLDFQADFRARSGVVGADDGDLADLFAKHFVHQADIIFEHADTSDGPSAQPRRNLRTAVMQMQCAL
jgi:hypothetical protein